MEAADEGDGLRSASSSPVVRSQSGNLSVWKLPSIKQKLKDHLITAQEALLQQSQERHEIYSATNSSKKDTKDTKAPTLPLPQSSERAVSRRASSILQVQDMAAEKREALEPLWPKRWHEPSDKNLSSTSPSQPQEDVSPESGLSSGRARANTLDNLTPTVAENMRTVFSDFRKAYAYMGIDWYTVQKKRQNFSLLFFIEELYYWCYATYIVLIILFGAVLFWYEPGGKFTFAQALYTSASCVSQSGLAVVDWSKQSDRTYVISFFLILLGSASLLHLMPVILRQNSFRMQAKMASWQKFVQEQDRQSRILSSGKLVSLPRSLSDPGVPETYVHHINHDGHAQGAVRWAPRQTSAEEADHYSPKVGTCSRALARKHRMEYKALGKVLKIMLGYWLVSHFLGALVFYLYFKIRQNEIQEKFHREGLHPLYHALYLSVSSFQNNGLVMTPSSVMDFVRSPILLTTVGVLIVLGNTGLPIMVRLIAAIWRRSTRPHSETRRVLDFLMEHPRRCFTHMFPAVHTMWLMLVVVGLNILGTLVILIQDFHSPAFKGLHAHEILGNAFFQTVSTRTAGMNSVNIAQLSQGTTFFMAVMMYFSTTPTVVTMRLSAAMQELDITGRVEGVEETVLTGSENSLKGQARRYLTQDATYLVVICFLICCFEQSSFARAARDPSPDSDGIYTDFGFFKVLFELLSAYGTCGLSLGYENQTFSFSGVWSQPSQLLLVATMILGRLRGLPDSIDASVRVAMTKDDAGTTAVKKGPSRFQVTQSEGSLGVLGQAQVVVARWQNLCHFPAAAELVRRACVSRDESSEPQSLDPKLRALQRQQRTAMNSNGQIVCTACRDRPLLGGDPPKLRDDEQLRLVTADVLLGLIEEGADSEAAALPLEKVLALPWPSGLGFVVDRCLFGGGLWRGEVVEIYGAPGTGKTQLGLFLAASTAASTGAAVHYITNKDPPATLAKRLQTIVQSSQVEDMEMLLGKIRISSMTDFTAFARLMVSALAQPGESLPALVSSLSSSSRSSLESARLRASCTTQITFLDPHNVV
ncbi:TRK2 [Symbiodinium natans]|uniref:TRK2 protein n=1 Tax=Symbiodinium natans TaxID=878477 RepID=A0A812URN0_9DINO|nr:TRK2 [Symbiodinium natans]